ncbi:MAG: dephospho-CoA kinase [archaeon GW2011_AR3]|nr:MAG: dephospho-CoA kinase [archaeon GW2011_AR3]MBS3109489.1 dephospho-CoA kinase [Candidatus Woesearchaeota archaeon]
MIITVTGKAGNGKSTVSKILKANLMNANVIRPDIIGIRLLSEPDLRKKLARAFGRQIIVKGKISRRRLANAAFKSKNSLSKLNSISHPAMIQRILNRARRNKISIIDAALFKELKLDRISDVVVLVKAKDEAVRKRLSKSFFRRRKFQSEPKRPDFIIHNNSSLSALNKDVKSVAIAIRKMQGMKQIKLA